jgi:hypothetical protein
VTARQRLLFLAALTAATGACEYLPPATQGWMVVLGDATRWTPDGARTPPSTQWVTVATPPPEPLCHAEDDNAVAVAVAIRAHFAEGHWSWACTVAWCESRFTPDARNGVHVGLFQINASLWAGAVTDLDADLWTFDGNAAVARYVLDEQGKDAWQCKA